MLIGYARTSTIDQDAGLAAQERDLRAVGIERIFSEQISSIARRDQLEAALGFIREGDTLVVTRLDRLARSIRDLCLIVDRLKGRGADLRILNMGIDTSSPQGKLMLTVFGGFAEFEREIMLERQREGISKAKSEGKYKGRVPTAQMKADHVRQLHKEGKGASYIGRELGISRSSVYRILES